MNISFFADPAFTRKHARLIFNQFFPLYMRVVWLRTLLFFGLVYALYQLVSFLTAEDNVEWLKSWGLPNSFSEWRYGPLAFILGLIAIILIAEWVMRIFCSHAERQFAIVAPPEQAEFTVTQTHVTMKSDTAVVTVPLDKVTGMALNKHALAIGFSGAGMIMPRSAFATPAEETAFIRTLSKGLQPEALQRSSEAVRRLL